MARDIRDTEEIKMTEKQRELAEYMSDLSELAYHASWMHGLEFTLWKARNGQLEEYGRLSITKEITEKLKILSEEVQGWIVFDDTKGRSFVSFEEWNEMNK